MFVMGFHPPVFHGVNERGFGERKDFEIGSNFSDLYKTRTSSTGDNRLTDLNLEREGCKYRQLQLPLLS